MYAVFRDRGQSRESIEHEGLELLSVGNRDGLGSKSERESQAGAPVEQSVGHSHGQGIEKAEGVTVLRKEEWEIA